MLSTRSMGVLVGIALAPMGLIFAYQAIPSGGVLPVSAQTVLVKDNQAPKPEEPSPPLAFLPLNMPAIPVPVDPRPAQADAPPLLPPDLMVTGPALPPPAPQNLPPMPLPMIDSGVVAASAQVPQPPAPNPQPLKVDVAPPSPGNIVVPSGDAPAIQKMLADSLETKNASPSCPWTLSIEIVDGRTQLTAQHGREVKFIVSCEKLDLQTPAGAIHANGKVKLTTDSIEGCCDRLTLSWQADIVVLDKAQLKCKLEGHEAELNADQLRVRLSRVITVSDPGEPQSSRGVVPAGSPPLRNGVIVDRRGPIGPKLP